MDDVLVLIHQEFGNLDFCLSVGIFVVYMEFQEPAVLFRCLSCIIVAEMSEHFREAGIALYFMAFIMPFRPRHIFCHDRCLSGIFPFLPVHVNNHLVNAFRVFPDIQHCVGIVAHQCAGVIIVQHAGTVGAHLGSLGMQPGIGIQVQAVQYRRVCFPVILFNIIGVFFPAVIDVKYISGFAGRLDRKPMLIHHVFDDFNRECSGTTDVLQHKVHAAGNKIISAAVRNIPLSPLSANVHGASRTFVVHEIPVSKAG